MSTVCAGRTPTGGITANKSHARPPLPSRAAYEAPRVQSLGPWAAITLIQSVPINTTGNNFALVRVLP